MNSNIFCRTSAGLTLRPLPLGVLTLVIFCSPLHRASAEEIGDYFAAALKTQGPVVMDELDVHLRDLAWSPDGEWIAFGANDSGNEDIWIRRAKGGERIQVTFDEATDVYAIWAPDGKSLLWASDRGGYTNLWSKNPFAAEAPQQVTVNADSVVGVQLAVSSFSPDGSRIAFTSTKGGNNDIWVRDLRSGATEQLTRNSHRDLIPGGWSPDGSQIAFSTDRANPGGSGDIWLIHVDSKAERQLTATDGWEWNPAWSPDGRFILYCQGTGNGIALYVTAVDGSRTEKVVGMPFFSAVMAKWVPGKPLLTFHGGHRRAGLFVFDPIGNTHAQVPIDDGTVAVQPSPSGKLLAAAVFEDSAVVLKEFIMDEATLHGRVISSFALKQWLQAQMRWHPDEKSLLLKLETGSQRHVLARVGLQEGSVKELVAEEEISLSHRPWAPSGKRIAYAATYGDGERDLFTISLHNNKKRQITFGSVMPQGYDWSPDNRNLVYAGRSPGQLKADLYSVPASRGKAKRLLAWEKFTEKAPQFSPDGKYVSFVSDRGGEDALWLLELESGAVRAVEGGEIGFSNHVWKRDGGGITWSLGQKIYSHDLSKEKTTMIYRGNSGYSPLGWNTDGGLLLRGRGNNGGNDLWLMRTPKLDPHI